MPVLDNPRHEKFAQELATGKSATEAYVLAGYRPSRKNASRLRANEGLIGRVQELQVAAARSTAITIESICAELDQANAVARERGQAAAMVSASALRAKLAGLMVERVEVSEADPFGHLESPDAIAQACANMLLQPADPLRPVSAADRRALADLVLSHGVEVQEFIDAIRARPLIGVQRIDNPANARSAEAARLRKLRGIGPPRPGRLHNGRS